MHDTFWPVKDWLQCWRSTKTMILEDAHEFIAVVNPVYQLDNQIYTDLVLWRYTAPSVKTSTIHGPSTKATSTAHTLGQHSRTCFWWRTSTSSLRNPRSATFLVYLDSSSTSHEAETGVLQGLETPWWTTARVGGICQRWSLSCRHCHLHRPAACMHLGRQAHSTFEV